LFGRWEGSLKFYCNKTLKKLLLKRELMGAQSEPGNLRQCEKQQRELRKTAVR